jgi:hypothetical protein
MWQQFIFSKISIKKHLRAGALANGQIHLNACDTMLEPCYYKKAPTALREGEMKWQNIFFIAYFSSKRTTHLKESFLTVQSYNVCSSQIVLHLLPNPNFLPHCG